VASVSPKKGPYSVIAINSGGKVVRRIKRSDGYLNGLDVRGEPLIIRQTTVDFKDPVDDPTRYYVPLGFFFLSDSALYFRDIGSSPHQVNFDGSLDGISFGEDARDFYVMIGEDPGAASVFKVEIDTKRQFRLTNLGESEVGGLAVDSKRENFYFTTFDYKTGEFEVRRYQPKTATSTTLWRGKEEWDGRSEVPVVDQRFGLGLFAHESRLVAVTLEKTLLFKLQP
jgi:hypothetical protein